MTKRKRPEQTEQDPALKLQFDQCEQLLDLLPRGTQLLDYTEEKQPSLRTRLQQGAFACLGALSTAIAETASSIVLSSIDASAPLTATVKRVRDVLHTEQARAQARRVAETESSEAETAPQEATSEEKDTEETDTEKALVSRPQSDKQSLMVLTTAGPLFSSATADMDLSLAQVDLPTGVHLTRVLPLPPTETGLLLDCHPRHRPAMLKTRFMEAARTPLPAPKRVRTRDAGADVGLQEDSTGSVLTARDVLPLRIQRHEAHKTVKPAQAQTQDQDTTMADASAKIAAAALDAALIEAYDPDQDISFLLAQLAALQNKRLAKDAFTSPSTEEHTLAQKIHVQISQNIIDAGLSPASLMPSQEARSGMVLTKYAPSYPGSLPTTMDGAVWATKDQRFAHPEVSPMARDIFARAEMGLRPSMQ